MDNSESNLAIRDAVQTTLNQFADSVRAGFDGLRDQLKQEQTGRTLLTEQVQVLATMIQKGGSGTASEETLQQLAEVNRRIDTTEADARRRQQDADDRIARVVQEVQSSLPTMVEAAMAPAIRPTVSRQDEVERDLKSLRASLEQFDSQAARMVSHVVEVTTSLTERVDSSLSGINQNVEERVSRSERRIDAVLAEASMGDAEVRAVIAQQVEEVEERVNGRVTATEARINHEVGQRIADIDAYVGRVSVGLDESITVLNNRIASSDGRFGMYDDKLNAMAKALLDVDAEAIDELKDRVRSVAGEAELVRIEMERFQVLMGDTTDKTTMRLTEVETQLQDQSMDTETAVQLERLEEVERALIDLDPSQFVRVDGSKNVRAVVGGYGVASEPPAPTEQAPAVDYSTEFQMAPLTQPLVLANGGPRSDPMVSFAPPANARR
jgi:hypothetical protein|tara:strand:- start:8852 stop:10168 length:1317 start_codon:yes stop_codon:yes gene_type:complete